MLEPGRKASAHDDDPSTASAYNAAAIGELAEDTDDNNEGITARRDEDEHDYDYEDSDEDRFDWLEQTYAITADELADALQELEPDDARAAVDAFEELYTLHLQGYGRDAAEEIYLQQYGDQDAGEEDLEGDDAGYAEEE